MPQFRLDGLISILPIRATSILAGQLRVIQESVGVERLVIWIDVRAMMDSPSRNENSGVLRNEHPLVIIIF